MHNHIGKIYQLSYPYTDASEHKERPAVIVIEENDDFEVLYITTHNSPGSIPIHHEDFTDGTLARQSYVKISKSIPFNKKFFTQETYMATISVAKMKEIVGDIVAKYQILLAELESIS